jgi:predicted transcriptional regulator
MSRHAHTYVDANSLFTVLQQADPSKWDGLGGSLGIDQSRVGKSRQNGLPMD